jgi:hypothetical protein
MVEEVWRDYLGRGYGAQFPNQAEEILHGITHGVDIEYTGDRKVNRRAPNQGSALTPAALIKVSSVIAADVAAGKKAGPFITAPFKYMSISPLGAVPKRGSTKLRVVHNLSHPFAGDSVNAHTRHVGITLGRFEHAAAMVRRHGRGCLMTKVDVEGAYKNVPVRRRDWHLLGFMWKQLFYYDRTLPFGLKSSCRKWELYATALHHFFQHEIGIDDVVHYIDDFFFAHPQDLALAKQQLQLALDLCARLGIPMSPDKTVGPCTRITFLGILLDSIAMTASLEPDRLVELHAYLDSWGEKTHATLQELQSLTGILSFASHVVAPGRTYLRRIIDHSAALGKRARAGGAHRSRSLPIPESVRDDIGWWRHFSERWNGVSLLYEEEWTNAEKLTLFTDACLTGYGARCGSHWFQGRWSAEQLAASVRTERESMPFLELLALLFAAVTWGHLWHGRKIVFRCDCQPVVQALASRTSRSPDMMHLIRQLTMTAATHQFDFRVEHIAGVANVAADALSRYDMNVFWRDCANQGVDAAPTPVAPLLLPLLRTWKPTSASPSRPAHAAPTRQSSAAGAATL